MARTVCCTAKRLRRCSTGSRGRRFGSRRTVIRPVRGLVQRTPHSRDENAGSSGPTGASGTAILKQLFLNSARNRLGDHPALREALEAGLPPLGEHAEMFRYVSGINRDVSEG